MVNRVYQVLAWVNLGPKVYVSENYHSKLRNKHKNAVGIDSSIIFIQHNPVNGIFVNYLN